MNLKEELKEIREKEITYPIEYFINDALEVCEYAKEDGFHLDNIVISLNNFRGNTDKLHSEYGSFYDENNRIYNQYKTIAGYLQCIGHDIYMIDKKLDMS